MLLLLCFLLFEIHHCSSDSMCKFELKSGEIFDLSKIPTIGISLQYCKLPSHRLVFNLCRELPDSSCPSGKSQGPGNACDVYGSGDDYYWIGGLNKWTVGEYDKKKRSFTMSYIGEAQPDPFPGTRNLEIVMECAKEEYSATCQDVEVIESEELTIYRATVKSKHACPEDVDSVLIAVEIVLIVIFVLTCCCCVFIIFLCCFCSAFWVGIMCMFSSSIFGTSMLYTFKKRRPYKKINTSHEDYYGIRGYDGD